ncbi:MAG: POT family proton-dependent oligopeptide transporter [Gammaproteobacteria bacterium]|jgi:POT family proton-dependent oligopeptide transporter
MNNNPDLEIPLSTSTHPRGLYTLFFTEMWERFSYYGMRALLVLFMTETLADGGLGYDDATATAIYGIYTAAVYVACLPGGWIADRLLGAQKAVWYGGIIIMLGHFTLAIPSIPSFYLGLMFVVLGTGLLKPNISAIVGELYPSGSSACTAGYTIFYMGINLGGFMGPLICSTLGESDMFGWHYGFAAAGIGMLFGLIQYRLTQRHLGDSGRYPEYLRADSNTTEPPRYGWLVVGIGVGLVAFVVVLCLVGLFQISPVGLARTTTYVIAAIATLYFVYVFRFGRLSSREKNCVWVIVILVIAEAVFWSGFEQAGSSLTLFADRYTDRFIFGFEIPTGWFQSLNPMFILILAPFFAAMWVNLGKRNLDPSIPAKFALGLIQLGLGFLVMFGASKLILNGDSVLPTWLFFTYMLHTMGELCLSPVGLSSISRLAPKRFVSQMMGIWFLGSALGNIIAGLLAGRFNPESIADMPSLYLQIICIAVGSGLLLLIFTKPIKRMIGEG